MQALASALLFRRPRRGATPGLGKKKKFAAISKPLPEGRSDFSSRCNKAS